MSKKTETIQEFLARGGKIKVIPPVLPPNERPVKSTNPGPAVLMTYEDADHYYGKKTERKKKEKVVDLSNVNLDKVPEDLRKILGI